MYENDVPAELGSYNSLQKQVAFCKMQVRHFLLLAPLLPLLPLLLLILNTTIRPPQGFDTMSRTTSGGPSVFTSGLVKIGVGLAHAQFGSRVDNSWLSLVSATTTTTSITTATSTYYYYYYYYYNYYYYHHHQPPIPPSPTARRGRHLWYVHRSD